MDEIEAKEFVCKECGCREFAEETVAKSFETELKRLGLAIWPGLTANVQRWVCRKCRAQYYPQSTERAK